ncbi:hypothetical protein [Pseudomonas synxantha]|uniref:hypothetical protein n=1 Tax=Pseudomonas synxantha TaxID=47883 RepID=UPI0019CFA861|nr:hypothetical protein [Pseudomonas synxantha]
MRYRTIGPKADLALLLRDGHKKVRTGFVHRLALPWEVSGIVKEERHVDVSLSGKNALITGSSKGIGEAIAKKRALEKATVIVHDRDAA